MAGSSKAFEMQRLPSEAAGVADSFVPGEGNDAVALDEVSESIYVSYNNRGDTIQGNPLLAFNKKKDMSNVRAKLKFIFPALAIGVSYCQCCSEYTVIDEMVIDVSICRRSDDHCVQLWPHRE